MIEEKVSFFSLPKIICFFFALHIVLITLVLWKSDTKNTVLKRAEKTRVSLGIRTAAAGATAMNEVTPQKTVVPPKKEKPKAIKKTEVKKPTPTKEVLEKSITAPKPKPIPKQEKELEAKEPIEKQIEKIEPEIVKKSTSQPLQKPQKKGSSGIDGSTDNNIKKHEVGQSTKLAGDPNSIRYDAILRAHLMKSKRYPRSLKMKRKEGTVEVAFTINQKGELLKTKIVKRTGDKAFNQAIKRLFKRAKPFPRPPADVNWTTREYQLHFNYQLN